MARPYQKYRGVLIGTSLLFISKTLSHWNYNPKGSVDSENRKVQNKTG